MRTAITIHGLADARTALTAAQALRVPVTLISGPSAGGYGGPGWFNAVVREARAAFPDVRVTAILDCGDAPAHALGAFRAGTRAVRFTGRADLADKLRDIAEELGAELITDDVEALDLRGERDPLAACMAWLSAHAAA
jgi:hypothetical protein